MMKHKSHENERDMRKEERDVRFVILILIFLIRNMQGSFDGIKKIF